jgi:carboxyl-terminal processing protease
VDPLLDPSTKLAVLVNRGTASAAEIVSGAIQDTDSGIIIGTDRTFGKGLVQNVEDLPFNTALKFTVAKYYTPSGRCIQGVQYKEGGGLREEDGKYTSSRISKKDRQVYYTKSGRIVRDGGGIEVDYKVPAPKASALEITLLRSDAMSEFAALWSSKNELTNNFEVTDDVYKQFQDFVESKRQAGEIKLEGLYAGALQDLKRALKESGYKGSEREVEQLTSHIVRDIKSDFEKYKKDIKEDIATSILARYLPESMVMERGLKTDTQVQEAVKLLANKKSFDKILAKGSRNERMLASSAETSSMSISNADLDQQSDGGKLKVDF